MPHPTIVGLCPVGNPLGGRCANPTYWTTEQPALSTKREAFRDGRLLLDDPGKLESKAQAVTPPRRILRSEADLETWVAEVRKSVLKKLPNSPAKQ